MEEFYFAGYWGREWLQLSPHFGRLVPKTCVLIALILTIRVGIQGLGKRKDSSVRGAQAPGTSFYPYHPHYDMDPSIRLYPFATWSVAE